MSLSAATTRFATWSITGVTNFGFSPPNVVAAGDCPCMYGHFINKAGEGEPIGFATGQYSDSILVRISMILRAAGHGAGVSDGNSLIIAYHDLLNAEIAADPDLNGVLRRKMKTVNRWMPVVFWGGQQYLGFSFDVEWIIKST